MKRLILLGTQFDHEKEPNWKVRLQRLKMIKGWCMQRAGSNFSQDLEFQGT